MWIDKFPLIYEDDFKLPSNRTVYDFERVAYA